MIPKKKLLSFKIGDHAMFTFTDNLENKTLTKPVEITDIVYEGVKEYIIGGNRYEKPKDITTAFIVGIHFTYIGGGGDDIIAVFCTKTLDDPANLDFNNLIRTTKLEEVKRLDSERNKLMQLEVGDVVSYKIGDFDARGIIGEIRLITAQGNDTKNIEQATDAWLYIIGAQCSPIQHGDHGKFHHMHVQFVPDRNIYYAKDKAEFDSLQKIS
jgi:hypothetical protein